jgi:2-amino-4-hydroxy-6-hydroxymethyldihydropteridine diphosphokinase
METAYLGLGSNMGDRAGNLDRALAELKSLGVEVTATSTVYRTAPVGRRDQPEFLNQAVAVRTELPPTELLALCGEIESRMGRRRLVPGGPRRIDLDLLLYADHAESTPDLTVPHPRMHLRRFVLAPLCEIGPDARHPVSGRTVRELLVELKSEEPMPVPLDGGGPQAASSGPPVRTGVDRRRGARIR